MKDFDSFFDKLAWGAITAIGLYAATLLKDMGASINNLNTNNAVFIERMNTTAENLRDHDTRIKELESKRTLRNR